MNIGINTTLLVLSSYRRPLTGWLSIIDAINSRDRDSIMVMFFEKALSEAEDAAAKIAMEKVA